MSWIIQRDRWSEHSLQLYDSFTFFGDRLEVTCHSQGVWCWSIDVISNGATNVYSLKGKQTFFRDRRKNRGWMFSLVLRFGKPLITFRFGESRKRYQQNAEAYGIRPITADSRKGA